MKHTNSTSVSSAHKLCIGDKRAATSFKTLYSKIIIMIDTVDIIPLPCCIKLSVWLIGRWLRISCDDRASLYKTPDELDILYNTNRQLLPFYIRKK